MKTIAWDIDDVLNNLMRVWLEKKWMAEHPKCPLDYAEIKENPPHRLLGVSKESYLASLDEFRSSSDYRKMLPQEEVKKWFADNGRFFRHIVITAVPIKVAHLSADWLLRNFGLWIRTFHFVPSPRKGSSLLNYDTSKRDFLNWLGKADIFVDDNELNVSESRKAKVKSILFPRPWNSSKLSVKETLTIITELR